MKKKMFLSRRDFIGKGVIGFAAGLTILPSSVLASPGPNEKVAVAFIGVGRRGQQLMGDLTQDARIVAISDLNEPRLEQLAAGKDWRTYTDYQKMLESKDIDAVLIATPDHWHALNSIHACMAGKDVYCEKPMTLTIREGRVMAQAVRKYNRVFQTGSQQRSMRECRIGCELVRNRRLGKITMIHGWNYPSPWNQEFPEQPVPNGLDWDEWLGMTPVRSYHTDIYTPRAKPGWISLQPYSGGEMTGWGAHGLDLIQWALGMDESGPVEVWPEGEGLECEVCYTYADGTPLRLDNKGPMGGALFVGDKGEIMVDRGKYEAKPPAIAEQPTTEAEAHLYVSNNHMQNWLDCIRNRERPIADVEIGHRSTTVCHLGNIARWTGRKLRWDPVKEEFIGDENANTYIDRPRRDPYKLPKI
jgi:predicted dehydrogenase